MTSEFKIEPDVPIPAAEGRIRYPFRDMQPGDSFYVEDSSIRRKVSAAASYFGIRHNMKFAVRKNGTGFRVWRTK